MYVPEIFGTLLYNHLLQKQLEFASVVTSITILWCERCAAFQNITSKVLSSFYLRYTFWRFYFHSSPHVFHDIQVWRLRGSIYSIDTVFSFPATCLSRCMHWCIVFLEDIRWLTDSFLFILGNYWPKICVQYFNVLPRVDVAFYRCQSTNRIKRYIPPEHPA